MVTLTPVPVVGVDVASATLDTTRSTVTDVAVTLSRAAGTTSTKFSLLVIITSVVLAYSSNDIMPSIAAFRSSKVFPLAVILPVPSNSALVGLTTTKIFLTLLETTIFPDVEGVSLSPATLAKPGTAPALRQTPAALKP